MVPRSGAVTIGNDVSLYSLPTDLEKSEIKEVRAAAKAVGAADNAARKAKKDAKKALKKAISNSEKVAIEADSDAVVTFHKQIAIEQLKGAVPHAKGKEKVAVLLENAQRYRDSGDCGSASEYFNKVAGITEQIYLKERVLMEIKMCPEKRDRIVERLE